MISMLRSQDGYHDLSEQEEEEEMQQIIARSEGHDTNAENQPGVENRPLGRRRIRSHAPQRRVLRQSTRPLQVLELAVEVQRTSRDLQHQGQGMERIRHILFDLVQEKVDHLEKKFQLLGEHLDGITATVDRNKHAKCASITAVINEQEDIRRLVEDLAGRLDHSQDRVTTTHSETSLAMRLEISDLKTKVLRLTEQCTEHDGKISYFSGMSEQVSLIEQQIHRWRYQLPDLPDDSSRERVISAIEVKGELDKFKDITRKKVCEVNNALCALEREVQLFERARDESWEAVSQRVSTLVDSSITALSERWSDLEHCSVSDDNPCHRRERYPCGDVGNH